MRSERCGVCRTPGWRNAGLRASRRVAVTMWRCAGSARCSNARSSRHVPRRRIRGFTLLEVLVVVTLFALLALIGHGALHTVLDARARVASELAKLQRVQSTFMLLERDLGQAVPRVVRDLHGVEQPAFAGAAHAQGLRLELTRAGWRNSLGSPRSTLQRVFYVLDQGVLRRVDFPVLDGASPDTARERVLLDEVHGVVLRFLDRDRRWHAQWPPAAGPGIHGPGVHGQPIAVELLLDIEGFGVLRRLFPLPAGLGA